MAKGRTELYEVLAKSRTSLSDPSTPPDPPVTAHDVVFGLDTAFILVLSVLFLIGTAYYLGHQKGEQQAVEDPSVHAAPPSIPELLRPEWYPPDDRVTFDPPNPEQYTLLLRLTEDHQFESLFGLRCDQSHLWQVEVVRQGGAAPMVLYQPPVFALAVGSFASRSDPQLQALLTALQDNPGPATGPAQPYANAQIRLIGELGERWW